MKQIVDQHQFSNITPQEVWNKASQLQGLILPETLRRHSSNHYFEIGQNIYGFHLLSPWGALPKGMWDVKVKPIESEPFKQVVYSVDVKSNRKEVFSGHLTIELQPADPDGSSTMIEALLSGEKGEVLANQSDEIVQTLAKGLLREGWAEMAYIITNNDSDRQSHSNDEDGHMAPLAIAAGVFSAGMALGLWFWRRRKRSETA
ncbi:MAG: hypothetical protein AAF902_05405 [Chloroflexota bacterium]